MSRFDDVLKAMDPARAVQRWPSVPPANWMAKPAGPTPAPQTRPWGRRTLLGAAMMSVATAGVVALNVGPSEPVYATPPPLRVQYEGAAPHARGALLHLAAVLNAAQPETRPAGRFSFVRVGQWSLDTSAAGGRTDAAVAPQVVTQWRAPDGAGRVDTVSLDQASVGQRFDVEKLTAAVTHGKTEVHTHGPGELANVVPDPVPSGLDALERALYLHQPRANGPESAPRAVADLYRTNAVDRDVRVSALRFLARADDVLLRGAVTDRLGRRGIAVSVDSASDGTRDLLVIDQRTGLLLAHESMFLRRPDNLPVQVPAVFTYVLYLDQGRSTRMP